MMLERKLWELGKESRVVLLGAMSLCLSVLGIPLGWIANTLPTILGELWGDRISYFTAVLCIVTSIPYVASVFCAVFALILFRKSVKRTRDYVGMALGIFSLALSIAGVSLFVAGFLF